MVLVGGGRLVIVVVIEVDVGVIAPAVQVFVIPKFSFCVRQGCILYPSYLADPLFFPDM